MKRHRLPFRDDMVREILADRKTVTRRTSARFANWKPGDIVDLCEGLRRSTTQIVAKALRDVNESEPVTMAEIEPLGWAVVYTSTGAYADNAVWRWKPDRLAPRYCPAGLIRHRLEVLSVEEERVGTWPDPFPEVDDHEAMREGFWDRAEFLAAWQQINGRDLPEEVYRIAFHRIRA